MKNIILTIPALLLAMSAMAQKDAPKYPMTQTYEHNPILVNFPSTNVDDPSVTTPFYAADPSARTWKIKGKEVLYLYPSHDQDPPRGCDRMDKYHVFSTTDLKTWTDYGEIFNAAGVNKTMGKDWTVDGFMWAPDCMYNPKDKLYYYYFPHPKGPHWGDSWEILVATSKSPSGPFKNLKCIKGTPGRIDPNVFLDDDGTLYFYVGGSAEFYQGKMKQNDWTTIDGKMELTKIEGADFHEGAWVFKRNGIYYLTYPDNHTPDEGGNALHYAIGKSPLGPWKEQGVYLYPHGNDTSHGSAVEFKGKWYQFYHTGNYGLRGNLRSVCFNELTFTPDGKINVIHNWGEPRGAMPEISKAGTIHIEAENYNLGTYHEAYFKRPGSEIKTDGNGKATWLKDMQGKEFSRYSVKVKDEGKYTVTLRVRPTTKDAVFHFSVNGYWLRPKVNVSNMQDAWIEIPLKGVELKKDANYIEWRGENGTMDIDWIEIAPEK